MAPIREDNLIWDLPRLKEKINSKNINAKEGDDFWAAAFYPYTEPGIDPVFAVVGGHKILIGRPPVVEGGTIEWLHVILDQNAEGTAGHYAVTWSKDGTDDTPWLCVSGNSGKIHIIDALTGRLLQTVIGHGGQVMELVTCPANPNIIASSSEDTSVRLWNLDKAYLRQPCVAILQGEGHRSDVLSIDFHISGNYLLSGGIDRAINVWTIPQHIIKPEGTSPITTNTNPLIIHYPHFYTSDISHDPVDCVRFYGDLVLCKSVATETITLFSITGFDSSKPIPTPETAPTTHDTTKTTRSAFVRTTVISSETPNKPKDQPTKEPIPLYTRLLTFAVAFSDLLFTRFSISPPSTGRAILGFGNNKAGVVFWDLDRLPAYYNWTSKSPWELSESPQDRAAEHDQPGSKQRPRFLLPFQGRDTKSSKEEGKSLSVPRERGRQLPERVRRGRGQASTPSDASRSVEPSDSGQAKPSQPDITCNPTTNPSESNGYDPVTGKHKINWKATQTSWDHKYELRDAFKGIEPHKTINLGGKGVGRYMAWSVDGEWCLLVGSYGGIALLKNKIAKKSEDVEKEDRSEVKEENESEDEHDEANQADEDMEEDEDTLL